MSREEQKVTHIFREYMAQELGSREVARSKKQLIREHFTEKPPLIFQPVFLMPALGFAVFLCFLIFQPEKSIVKPLSEPLKTTSVTTTKAVPVLTPYHRSDLEVKVRQVSSEVGATMIYQKADFQTPITIIWVFTGGR